MTLPHTVASVRVSYLPPMMTHLKPIKPLRKREGELLPIGLLQGGSQRR